MRSVLLAAIAIVSLGACDDGVPGIGPGDCMEEHEQDLTIDLPVGTAIQFKIDQCRIDADGCRPLCAAALGATGISTTTVNQCGVRFFDDHIDVTARYTLPNPNPPCFGQPKDTPQPEF